MQGKAQKKYLEPVQVIDFTPYREKVSKQMKFPKQNRTDRYCEMIAG